MKKEQAQRRRDEEDYFARMWLADVDLKARREQEDARRQDEANRQTLAVLQQQMAELEEKKRQEKQLLEEQAQILVSVMPGTSVFGRWRYLRQGGIVSLAFVRLFVCKKLLSQFFTKFGGKVQCWIVNYNDNYN